MRRLSAELMPSHARRCWRANESDDTGKVFHVSRAPAVTRTARSLATTAPVERRQRNVRSRDDYLYGRGSVRHTIVEKPSLEVAPTPQQHL